MIHIHTILFGVKERFQVFLSSVLNSSMSANIIPKKEARRVRLIVFEVLNFKER